MSDILKNKINDKELNKVNGGSDIKRSEISNYIGQTLLFSSGRFVSNSDKVKVKVINVDYAYHWYRDKCAVTVELENPTEKEKHTMDNVCNGGGLLTLLKYKRYQICYEFGYSFHLEKL